MTPITAQPRRVDPLSPELRRRVELLIARAAAEAGGELGCPLCRRPLKSRTAMFNHLRYSHTAAIAAMPEADVPCGGKPCSP